MLNVVTHEPPVIDRDPVSAAPNACVDDRPPPEIAVQQRAPRPPAGREVRRRGVEAVRPRPAQIEVAAGAFQLRRRDERRACRRRRPAELVAALAKKRIDVRRPPALAAIEEQVRLEAQREIDRAWRPDRGSHPEREHGEERCEHGSACPCDAHRPQAVRASAGSRVVACVLAQPPAHRRRHVSCEIARRSVWSARQPDCISARDHRTRPVRAPHRRCALRQTGSGDQRKSVATTRA